MFTSISEKGSWLSDYIPLIDFDISQNGNVRKADKAEALFCSVVISNIMKEKELKIELEDYAKTYDFSEMKSNVDDDKTFN